jgi:hypothetical protein
VFFLVAQNLNRGSFPDAVPEGQTISFSFAGIAESADQGLLRTMTTRAIYASVNTVINTMNRRSSVLLARSSKKFVIDVRSQRQTAVSLYRSSIIPTHVRLSYRSFSSLHNFKPIAPESLTSEIAEGILDLTQFYCRFGVTSQQLRHLAAIPDISVIDRWQQMLEIYVTTQMHVVAGLGYESNAEGLNEYARQFLEVVQKMDETMKQLLFEIRRDTWRGVVGTVFHIDPKDIPVLTIEEARELMHKVSNKMVDPDMLLSIQNRTANVRHDNPDIELQMKHQVLQKILVEDVYIGGSPSLIEQAGFGTGGIGYAKVQCALSDHENDPIMANYASTAMVKILSAAGIDIDKIEGPGLSCNPV